MKRFLIWIIYGNILILYETDFSEQKTVGKMDLAEVAKMWKQVTLCLPKIQEELFGNEGLPKGKKLSEEDQQSLKPFRQMMEFTYSINQQLEHDLNDLIKNSSDTEKMSHEFQYWIQALKKSTKKVSKQIADMFKSIGLKPIDPSSVEKLDSKIKNAASKSLALTLLLRNSNFTALDRFLQSLTKVLTSPPG